MEEKESSIEARDENKFYLVVKVSRWTKIRNYILQKIKWESKEKKESFWEKVKNNFYWGTAQPIEIRMDSKELKKW